MTLTLRFRNILKFFNFKLIGIASIILYVGEKKHKKKKNYQRIEAA
jgi:hypothetical protein